MTRPELTEKLESLFGHWRAARDKLSPDARAENLRCAADVAEAFGIADQKAAWRDGDGHISLAKPGG